MQQDMWLEDVPQSTSPWRLFLFASRPYRGAATIASLCVILGGVMGVAVAYIFKLITNSAYALAQGGGTAALWEATIAYIIVSLFATIFWRGSGLIGMYWSVGVRATTRYALSAYVTRHSHAYFADRFAGSISSKISQASNSIKDIVESLLWNFLPFFISVIGSFALAFYTSPAIAFVFLAWVLVITPINVYLVRKGVPLSVATQKAETAVSGATVDMLTNMTAVQEYAHRPFELERLRSFILTRRLTGLANWRFREIVRLGNGILQTLFIGGMIGIATILTGKGLLSAGDIILILTIILMIEDRLTFIGNQLNNFGDAWGQVTESLADIIRPYDITDSTVPEELAHVQGAIDFTDVSFSYGGEMVLNNLSLHIQAGQRVGLVGHSGAGKSTLIKLLLRHYTLTSGAVAIDGHSIAETTSDSLHQAIAIVPQEPLLFHRTVRENIAYGRLDATHEEIEYAARLAEAHDFIMQLSGGYDALVGERGVKLSGGQRQRVVIARAILKNAPILLLDEATSSLDSESEGAVQKALLALMKQRTVIAIAHRLSTLRAMDRIIVMENGQIVEDGTHAELLEQKGIYASLWNHQAGGFLED